MQSKNFGVAVRVAASLLTAGLISTAAVAQEIKISHQWKANSDGRDVAARLFIEEVNKKDPSLKFRIYPSSSLGIKPVAQLDALQNGTLEMAIFPMSYAVGKAKEFSGVILPGTVPNLDFAMRLRNSPYYQKIQDLSEKNGFRIITWWWTPGGFATKDTMIKGPSTVNGQKMRAADPTFESMLKAAGASVSAMASSEFYPALQSGVLTGGLTSAETFVSMRLYEQTKMATLPGEQTLWMLMQPMVMSTKAWNALTPAQQKIFEEAAAVSNDFFLKEQRKAVEEMGAAYKKAGGQTHVLTKAEFDEWIELAKKTAYPEYAAISPLAKSILQDLQNAK
jgi:TRAP-type transport system periplasmic protein